MHRLFHLILLCLFGVVETHGEIQNYFFHYTTEDGLASNNVHDVVEDQHGFIWFATHYGISRFDGCSFRNYDEAHFPEMKRNDAYHAFLLPNGEVSFGGASVHLILHLNSIKNLPFHRFFSLFPILMEQFSYSLE